MCCKIGEGGQVGGGGGRWGEVVEVGGITLAYYMFYYQNDLKIHTCIKMNGGMNHFNGIQHV